MRRSANLPAVWAPQSPGHRGHPPRPHLMRAERGNPVGVRLWAGKPTVREAQLPSGQRMTKKRTPAAERQQETGTGWLAPPSAVSYNWPDTGLCPTRKGADVVRWACEKTMADGPGTKGKLDAPAGPWRTDQRTTTWTGCRLTGSGRGRRTAATSTHLRRQHRHQERRRGRRVVVEQVSVVRRWGRQRPASVDDDCGAGKA